MSTSSRNTADEILAEVYKSLEDDDDKSAKLNSVIPPPLSADVDPSSSKSRRKKKKKHKDVLDSDLQHKKSRKHKKPSKRNKEKKKSKKSKSHRSKRPKLTVSNDNVNVDSNLSYVGAIVSDMKKSSKLNCNDHPCDPVTSTADHTTASNVDLNETGKVEPQEKQRIAERKGLSRVKDDAIETRNRSPGSGPPKDGTKRLIIGLSETTKAILSKEPDHSQIHKRLPTRPDEDGEILRSDYSDDEFDDKDNDSSSDSNLMSCSVTSSRSRKSDRGEIKDEAKSKDFSPSEKRGGSTPLSSGRRSRSPRRSKSRSPRSHLRRDDDRRCSDDEESGRSRSPQDMRSALESRRGTATTSAASKRYLSRRHWKLGDKLSEDVPRIEKRLPTRGRAYRSGPQVQRFRTDRSRSRSRYERRRSRSGSPRKDFRKPGPKTAYARREKWRLSQSPEDVYKGIIDKKELLEIAKRNASAMLQQGTLQQICNMTSDEIAKLKAGGTSVDELVDYCKKLQRKQEKAEQRRKRAARSGSNSSASSSDESTKAKVHHPFALNPSRNNIVFNVRNITQIPIKTPVERAQDEGKLRLTYPVSSGQQHRTKESEWVPVSPTRPAPVEFEKRKAIEAPPKAAAPATPLPPPPAPPPVPPTPPELKAALATSAATEVGSNSELNTSSIKDSVFPDENQGPVDIGDVVAKRLKAIQRLYSNPNDAEALQMMHYAEEMMRKWAESKNVPGAFFGSTGAQCLTPDELAPKDQRFQAWAKKDQFAISKPLESGVGMTLLQKMGWKPGEGLGKNKAGALKPLLLDVKSDRKGLVSNEELLKNRPQSLLCAKTGIYGGPSQSYSIHGKHPVSVLMELCAKRRWHPPSFTCVEQGPPHSRRFIWKVLVNGVEYQPATPCNNKKQAKLHAAQVAVQSLGLAPRDPSLPVVIG